MATINSLNFIGQANLAADTTFDNTDVRDLSGIFLIILYQVEIF